MARNMHATDLLPWNPNADSHHQARHTYHYRQPVAFGEHRMMCAGAPRDDDDQRVLQSGIAITPEPSGIDWPLDSFGNHVATARFATRAAELRSKAPFASMHAPAVFRTADIADHARTYSVRPTRRTMRRISPATSPGVRRTPGRTLGFGGFFLRDDGSADTHALLVGMTQTIRSRFRHGARHQKGTQDPPRTLELASGSCRDLAVLMIAALRTLGIAARFVSGYLNLADPDDDSITGGNTHAWVAGLHSRPRLGRFRSVQRNRRQSEPRARRSRARAARSDPAGRDIHRICFGPPGDAGRGQGCRGKGRVKLGNFISAICLLFSPAGRSACGLKGVS